MRLRRLGVRHRRRPPVAGAPCDGADAGGGAANTLAALAAYNAGEGRVDRWLKAGVWDGTARRLGDIPFGETR
ncbi:hypothetical protein AB1399_02715, partial [Hydrogenibacillus schlegelii]